MSPDLRVSFALCLFFIVLVPLTIAGLALINAGLGRSRSAAHAMTGALCVTGVAILTFCAWGFALRGESGWFPEVNGRFSQLGLFFRGGNNLEFLLLPALLGTFSVAFTSLIPTGAAADRWRISAACASTVVLSGFVYPIFGHLADSGFLWSSPFHPEPEKMFLDVGGSGFVNAVGGLSALSIAWILGPRQSKYPPKGMPAAIPAHNQVFVLFGCMVAWVGWLGLNSAGAILYAGVRVEGSILVVINTTVSAAAAALTSAITTRIRFRRPDASLIANGWMAGLVASSAGCAMLKPATAILTGIVAGVLVVLSVEWFELHAKVDDPSGSVSVHAVCGIWGLLAAGIFSGSAGQFTAQIVGIATLLGFVFPLTYGLNWLLNRLIPYRVSADGERQGLDLHELGADAYPEFVVHSEEFMQR